VDDRGPTEEWNSDESGLLTGGETVAQSRMTISPRTACWLLSCICTVLMDLRKWINYDVWYPDDVNL
jgi:hypothetical protein